MKKIRVKLSSNPYNIYIKPNLLKSLPSIIKKYDLGNFGIVITSKSVGRLYRKKMAKIFPKNKYLIITVADGEKAKSKTWLFKVIDKVVKADTLSRQLFLICFGGGVVGDLGGFIAAIYKRGIPYIQIPTTLLSQIDSSIGGKTAIDLPIAKNILGAFYQPKAVCIDPLVLKTLPAKEFKQGLAEAIKYSLIKDKTFFAFLKKNHALITKQDSKTITQLISTCVRIKAQIVEADEKETKGLRTILNFGHTLAHALESSSKYRSVPHGYAVSIGMLYAARLSQYLKKSRSSDVSEVEKILKLYSLPTKFLANPLKLYQSLVYDKKFIRGKIRMVLLKNIGKVSVVEGIRPETIKLTLERFGTK
tara:strand:+ start:434 stop:1519 length:1086 start_codon:yes stop_codon:yes gene_type:complete